MINQVFVPTVAELSNDIKGSLSIQKPLIDAGYNPGLMLVIRKGKIGLIGEIVQKQYSNLEEIAGREYGDSPIITMLSNIPIYQIDFLHNTKGAVEHVKYGVDFAAKLPIGGRRIITFHLNSLIPENDFVQKDEVYWSGRFKKTILPALIKIARYAQKKGVEVKIETVPVPEFGNISSSDNRTYRNVRWNELRNPFYFGNETHILNFENLRQNGLGVCLDICHSRVIPLTALTGESEGILHHSDIEQIINRGESEGVQFYDLLFEDVKALESTDIIHLNDGKGVYSKIKDTVFLEGVALGQGDIKNLREIIGYINENGIPWVLEVNEQGDFKNRPGSRASIEYLLG